MPRTVIHIGTVKTGTTFIQRCLAAMRPQLAEAGWLYPGPIHCHVPEFASLLGDKAPWSGPGYEDREQLWDPLAADIAGWDGSLLLSAENLAGLRAETIPEVLEAVGRDSVEIVITARDLARVLPSDLQQGYRTGRSGSGDVFFGELDKARDDPQSDWWWWRANSMPGLVERWLAAPHVKSVTIVVNPANGSTDTLWDRFIVGAGIPLAGLELPALPGYFSNPSLDVDQARLLRYLTLDMRARNGVPEDDQIDIRLRIVQSMLERQSSESKGAALAAPWRWRARMAEWAAQDIAKLATQKFRLVGDLQELAPVVGEKPVTPEADPTDVPEADVELMRVGVAAVRAAAGHPKYLEPNRITVGRLAHAMKAGLTGKDNEAVAVGAPSSKSGRSANGSPAPGNFQLTAEQARVVALLASELDGSVRLPHDEAMDLQRRVLAAMAHSGHRESKYRTADRARSDQNDATGAERLAGEIVEAAIAVYGHEPCPPAPITVGRLANGIKRRMTH